MSTNDGGPAFPAHPSAMGDHDGMSLRDYFAAKAMQGMLAARHPTHSGEDGADTLADDSYIVADAMLAAREAK